jgi:hypothetical protein
MSDHANVLDAVFGADKIDYNLFGITGYTV